MLMGWATWRRLPWKPFPPWVAVQANSQGWAANDGETMRSPLSLRAAPVAGFENGYEVDGRSVASPAAKPAKVTLVRIFCRFWSLVLTMSFIEWVLDLPVQKHVNWYPIKR